MIKRPHAKYYPELFVKKSVVEDVDTLSLSLVSASVDVVPNQIEAALFAFKPSQYKDVVCVGDLWLGKTIETGLVHYQYRAMDKSKNLIVCASSARKQRSLERMKLQLVVMI